MEKSSTSNPQTKGERDYSIDVAKAALIFLVVWGHAIQYLHGSEFNFWEDFVFKLIYGFHMPLFALISGHLMAESFKRYDTGKLIGKRAKQLLIPTVGWALVLTVIDIVLNVLTHEQSSASWIAGRFLSRTVNDLWFLKAMFIACVVVVFMEKCCKGHWIAYGIGALLTLLLPKAYNLALYGFVLPFFMLGYKVGGLAKKWNDALSSNKRVVLFIVSLIAYVGLLLFFHKDNYIYTTGLRVFRTEKDFTAQLGIDVYRCLVALVGCIAVLEGSTLITKKNHWVPMLSIKTMGIYIVTATIFTYIPQLMSRAGIQAVLRSIPAEVMDIVLLIPVSVIMMILSLLAEKVIERIKLGKVLLGK